MIVPMRALIHAAIAVLPLFAQPPDHYPRVRELALEAEKAAAGKLRSKDGGDPHSRIGDILARAGYTEDAERLYRKSPFWKSTLPVELIRAWGVYGQRERAEKTIETTPIPVTKAMYLASYADLLWRMGEPEAARKRYEEARTIAKGVADPAKRKSLLATIEQGLQFVSDRPPSIVSAEPKPSPRIAQRESPFPAFPITPGGLRDVDQALRRDVSDANGELLKRLYERAIAGDRAGVEQLLEKATTPFQRAFGFASLEHVFIQLSRPEEAEKYANRIPEDDSESTLAKAEALSAAADAWLLAGQRSKARAAFDSAKRIALTATDSPFSQIAVLVAAAASERRAGWEEESTATLQRALAIVGGLSPEPTPPAGQSSARKRGVHYREDALELILDAAVAARNREMVESAAKVWPRSGGGAGSAIAQAWLDAGETDLAITAARGIENVDARVSSLLLLALRLLGDAGAPTF